MHCKKPIAIFKDVQLSNNGYGILVPCGKCVYCRVHKIQEWEMRCFHESLYWDNMSFLTLTLDDFYMMSRERTAELIDVKLLKKYNMDKIPVNVNSIFKRELKLFFKRLRKIMDRKKRKFKYIACGEYGKENLRSHYHAVLFGISEDDIIDIENAWSFRPDIEGMIKKKCLRGRLLLESCSLGAVKYVCKYIHKRLSKEADYDYKNYGMHIPFLLTSKGFGAKWCDENKDKIIELKYISHKGKKIPIPMYYKRRVDPDGRFDFGDYGRFKFSTEFMQLIREKKMSYNDVIDYMKKRDLQVNRNIEAKIRVKDEYR